MRVSLVCLLFLSLVMVACQDQSPTSSKPSTSPAKTPAVSPPATPAPTPSPSQPQATPAASGVAPAARQPIAWSRELVEKKLASIQSMRFKTTTTTKSPGSSYVLVSEGCFARPYKFRVSIREITSPPTPQTGIMVCDGQSFLEGTVLGNGPVTQATTCNVSTLVSSGVDMDFFLSRKLGDFPLLVFRSFAGVAYIAEVSFVKETMRDGKLCGQFSVKVSIKGRRTQGERHVYIDANTMLPVAFTLVLGDQDQNEVTYAITNVNEPLPSTEFSFPPVQGNAQDLTSAYLRLPQKR